MEGIINVYKEAGFTSHDVVAKLRGILHMKKIGHTGTLDPDAVGVLPVCVGKATKLCGLITDWDKTYEAVMLLGKTTDTQDISGNITEEKAVEADERMIIEAVSSMAGESYQIPPMYSALKVNGKKLYELARAGIEVQRAARPVYIESIRINDINLAESLVTFTVTCSKGTYVRTLCHDIGQKLGCGACMMSLKRIRVGCFNIDDSLTLAQLEKRMESGTVEDIIIPVDEMFEYPKVTVKEEYNKLLYNGNVLDKEAFSEEAQEFISGLSGEEYRVYDCNKTFIGIYRMEETGKIKLIKMFYQK